MIENATILRRPTGVLIAAFDASALEDAGNDDYSPAAEILACFPRRDIADVDSTFDAVPGATGVTHATCLYEGAVLRGFFNETLADHIMPVLQKLVNNSDGWKVVKAPN